MCWVTASAGQDSPSAESAHSVASNKSESLEFASINSKDSFPAPTMSTKQKGVVLSRNLT